MGVRMWHSTKLDDYIEKIELIGLGIIAIGLFISAFNSMILSKTLMFLFMIHLLFNLRYGLSRGGNMKFSLETPREFRIRTGREYIDNTPSNLTYWKAIKIYYNI